LQATEVEHVLPQTLSDAWRETLGPAAESIHADWLHCPGNLTLSAYNQELWNHPFKTKRERYAQSNIVLTRELASSERWGEDEIRERGLLLAKEALRIWIGPKEQIARPEQETTVDEEEPGRYGLRRRFWTGLNDYLVAEHPDLPDFEARPNWTIRLPSGIRHVGLELRLSLRHGLAGIDLWFWREASFPLWDRIRTSPKLYNDFVDAQWGFEQLQDRLRGRMYLDHAVADLRNESSWPDVYRWLGEKLSLVYERVTPTLRKEMDRIEAGT
jgi:hypothetical protein